MNRRIQWVAALPAVAGFLLVLAWIGAPSAAERETLQRQFHLPPGVAVTRIRVDRKAHASFSPTVEGLVQFSEQDVRRYLDQLNDTHVWRPVPIRLEGRDFEGSYSPGALRWNRLGERR